MASAFKTYCVPCSQCSKATTKKYAREHGGLCKECVTGESQEKLFICPDCHERRLTKYQKAHRYHCDTCTKNVETSGGIYGF